MVHACICACVDSQRQAPAATMAPSSCVIVRRRRAATGHRGVLLGSPSALSASTGITMGRSGRTTFNEHLWHKISGHASLIHIIANAVDVVRKHNPK